MNSKNAKTRQNPTRSPSVVPGVPRNLELSSTLVPSVQNAQSLFANFAEKRARALCGCVHCARKSGNI